MLKIRLNKKGVKNKPFYNIIVINSKNPRDGKFLDKLGYYNPFNKDININIKKFLYWKSKGALFTNVIYKLLKIFKKNEFNKINNN